MKAFSVIIPTKNSEEFIERCLNSISAQDIPKDQFEIIIVDGNSRDNTLTIARRYGCKIINESVGNQAGAYNAGIKHAEGRYLLFTDSDCYVSKDWADSLTERLKDIRIASVGGPNFTPEDDREIGKCAGVVLNMLSKAGARYGMIVDEDVETFHNPTCNVAYKREVLLEVGGFNDRLISCADEELDFRIKEKGYRILYTPKAKVFHYRRASYAKFAQQAYDYAVGRAQSIKIHHKMAKWFHFAPSLALFSLLVVLLISVFNSSFTIFGFSIISIGFTVVTVAVLFHSKKSKTRKLHCLGLTFSWLIAYGIGFIRGLLSRGRKIP